MMNNGYIAEEEKEELKWVGSGRSDPPLPPVSSLYLLRFHPAPILLLDLLWHGCSCQAMWLTMREEPRTNCGWFYSCFQSLNVNIRFLRMFCYFFNLQKSGVCEILMHFYFIFKRLIMKNLKVYIKQEDESVCDCLSSRQMAEIATFIRFLSSVLTKYRCQQHDLLLDFFQIDFLEIFCLLPL